MKSEEDISFVLDYESNDNEISGNDVIEFLKSEREEKSENFSEKERKDSKKSNYMTICGNEYK